MGIYTNFFNETPEEQERRRQMLYQKYDDAVQKSQQNETIANNAEQYSNATLPESLLRAVDSNVYSLGERLGEFIADAQIAVQEKKRMDENGRSLVNMYGSGAGKDIDNYHHALLQCNLAKISPNSRENGFLLGKMKEYLYDYPRKSNSLGGKINENELWADINKDLANNEYGSQIGENNPQNSCVDLLEKLRTKNMRRGRFF